MPADHPIEAFRGRTNAELLALSEQMATALTQPRAPDPPPRAPEQPRLPTNEDWMYRPNEAAAMLADQRMQAAMNPVMGTLEAFRRQNADTMRAIAAQRYPDEFRRWAAEIDGTMGQVPLEQRNLDAYEKVIRYVRGKPENIEALARERAEKLMASGGLGERSTGIPGLAPSGANPLNFDTLPPEFAEQARRVGLSAQQVVEFCRKTGTPIEQWVANAKAGKVFTSNGGSAKGGTSFTLTEEAVSGTRQFQG